MQRIISIIVISVGLIAAVFLAGHPAAGSKPTLTASRDLADAEVRRAMDRLFRARVRATLAWTDTLATECKGQPMYHLMRARLLREMIPVDDESKGEVKRLTEPLYEELGQVIAQCNARIDAGDSDEQLRLYRGWAWMFMSHMRTYEKSFWAAGRESKKGKEDLDWYLEKNPGDPMASGLMGAFLYFADTLPSAYKFVSKLLFLPSGDRDRGLAMMEAVRGSNSPTVVDNALILNSVYIGFEGRYEEGLDGFRALRGEYPLHATFVRPEAILHPLLPRRESAFGDSLDAAVTRIESQPEADKPTLTLVRFQRAYADRFYHPQRAVARFEEIIRDDPKHPDWVTGFATFELGRLMAARGDANRARSLWKQVLRDSHVHYLHSDAKAMLTELQRGGTGSLVGVRNIEDIYSHDEAARERVRAELLAIESPSVAQMFYVGESWLLSGNPDAALTAYTGAINPTTASWDACYQMLASARAGEILGSRGDYGAAAKHYERAGTFWHREYLYDWILDARRRYFTRLQSGEEKKPPTLLSATM